MTITADYRRRSTRLQACNGRNVFGQLMRRSHARTSRAHATREYRNGDGHGELPDTTVHAVCFLRWLDPSLRWGPEAVQIKTEALYRNVRFEAPFGHADNRPSPRWRWRARIPLGLRRESSGRSVSDRELPLSPSLQTVSSTLEICRSSQA